MAAELLQTLDEYVIVSNPTRTAGILAGEIAKDLDLLVSPAAWRAADRVLTEAGFQIELKHGSPEKVLYFSYGFERRHLLMLDLYWRYLHRAQGRWYDLKPAVREAVLATAQADAAGLRHALPRFRMLFILLGMLLKGNTRDRYVPEVAAAAGAVGELQVYLTDTLSLNAASAAAVTALLTGGTEPDREHVERFLACVCDRVSRGRTLGLWYAKYPWLMRPVLRRPAPMVAVVGIDGAGKSTLSETLTGRFPIKVKRLYWASRTMILPTTRAYRWLERRLLKADVRRTDIPEQRSMPGQQPKRYGWKALFKWPILAVLNVNKYAEYLAKFALLRLHKLRGCVTITDRYVCDEELEYQDRFYRLNRWLYRHAYPKPDILVIATARPETIHARKPTIPAETAAHYHATYRALATEYARRGVEVLEVSSDDAGVEENVDRVVDAIFERWFGACA